MVLSEFIVNMFAFDPEIEVEPMFMLAAYKSTNQPSRHLLPEEPIVSELEAEVGKKLPLIFTSPSTRRASDTVVVPIPR